MTRDLLTLDQCGRRGSLSTLDAGDYVLEYTDATHLNRERWIAIATITVEGGRIHLGEDAIEQFYAVRKTVGDLPDDRPARQRGQDAAATDAEEREKDRRTIADAMSLALGRLGLLTPTLSNELVQHVVRLNQEDGVVLVPDTNALHNGALHWLLRVLPSPSVLVMPTVASMTTVQTRDAMLKGLLGKFRFGNIRPALRSRGLVNGALGLIERNKGRIQVVEIDPALLRYQKMASGSGADPDQGDVLEDRLIIEGIHNVLRSIRSRTARRVVTSDVNIARVLMAEGVETLFVPAIQLGDQPLDCLRFDPLAKGFVGAPLRALLWEFAHAFGSVRLVGPGGPLVTLDCYWPGKTPSDWTSETLLASFAAEAETTARVGQAAASTEMNPEPATAATNEPEDPTGRSSMGDDAAEPRVAPRAETGGLQTPSGGDTGNLPDTEPMTVRPKGRKRSRASNAPTTKDGSPPAISTILPRASFPQILRLLGAAQRLGGGTAEAIVAASSQEPTTVDTGRRALEILRRTGLLEQRGAVLRPTRDAEAIASSLRVGDLDAVSAVFERFAPYQILLQELKARGHIPRTEVFPLLKSALGPVGSYESERLPRFLTLLGQAWTDDDGYRDGSARPTDRDAADAFETAFAETASDRLAKVVDFLPRFCTLTGMSPWAAKRKIARFVAERLLPAYSFQPAAGGKPAVRDEVVSGSLDQLIVEPVAIDRLHLGERPVFTIGGPVR